MIRKIETLIKTFSKLDDNWIVNDFLFEKLFILNLTKERRNRQFSMNGAKDDETNQYLTTIFYY